MPMPESITCDDTMTGFFSERSYILQTQESIYSFPHSAYLSLALDRCLPFLDHVFPV